MSVQDNMRQRWRLFLFAAIFLVLFLGTGVRADAAWKKNANGTYSWYKNGKLVRNKWIEDTYYVDKNGIRKTGWMQLDGKWYFFTKSGRVLKNMWIRSEEKEYYAGPNGALYTGGRHLVGENYYAFSARGVKLTGMRTYKGKTYFFGTKTGKMLTSSWVFWNNNYYYFGKDGALLKNQWVGRYYVGKKGTRLKNTWKEERYLGSNGKCLSGIHKIGNYYYCFNPETYKKVKNVTVKEDGVTYQFSSDGKGKITARKKAPATKVNVEKTYYSDRYVNEETLLGAIIYCEAGNQSYIGKLAVGLVIMNRVRSPLFPSTAREVIYQKQQFEPARNGSLTRALKNPEIVTDDCKKAAAAALERYEEVTSISKMYIKLKGKKTNFPYLFFMTKPAYQRLGLTAKTKKIGDHVFFSKWG